MRITLTVLACVLGLLGLAGCQVQGKASGGAPSGDIAWHETLDAGLQAAKAENKLVFVDFSAEW